MQNELRAGTILVAEKPFDADARAGWNTIHAIGNVTDRNSFHHTVHLALAAGFVLRGGMRDLHAQQRQTGGRVAQWFESADFP